jgi:signal transduction histidine kinase
MAAVRGAGAGTLTLQVDPGLRAFGRPDHLSAIVANLLAKVAVHAPGSPVVLRARPAGKAIEITVADRGAGLAGSDLDVAFERGWPGQESKSRPVRGWAFTSADNFSRRRAAP